MRGTIEIQLRLQSDGFRSCCLRGRLVYLVLVFRRPDADEHGAAADSIAFRNVAHPAVLAAHLFERNDISRNPEPQWSFRIGGHYGRETLAVRADAGLHLNGFGVHALWGLLQWLIRATA